jgi:hypothetical protein
MCGIYCEHCPIFRRKENRCYGCEWINSKKRQLRESHKGCCFYECAQKKDLESCFLCEEFPCNTHYDPKEAVYTEQSLQTWKELIKRGIVFEKDQLRACEKAL